MADRAYQRCPDGDRSAEEPGGMECEECGCIFIGADWHSLCAVCRFKVGAKMNELAHDYSLSVPLPISVELPMGQIRAALLVAWLAGYHAAQADQAKALKADPATGSGDGNVR